MAEIIITGAWSEVKAERVDFLKVDHIVGHLK